MKKILVLLFMMFLVACSGEIVDPGDADSSTDTQEVDVSATESDVDAVIEEEPAMEEEIVVEESPAEEVDDTKEVVTGLEGQGLTTASGLQYIEFEEGTGAQAEAGKLVAVHYTGTLVDGTVFDSSIERGQPIEFPLGQGRVIPGWDEGIALMKEGGKALLVIPPELGYGAGGSGSIPPDSTLIFEVELVSVGDAAAAIPQPAPAADLPLTAEEYDGQGTITASGLQYIEIEEGTGAQAEADRTVMVHYTGKLTDGTVFDSSEGREPFTFALGRGAVIPGWDEGVALMKEGGTAVLVIPSDLAYGDRGAGGVIPPGATLVFDVELVEVGDVVASAPENFEAIDESDYTTTDSGLQYYDIEVGQDGVPELGVPVSMHFTVWFESGEKIDSSIDAGQPMQAVLGQGQLFPGWEEGVATMQYGGVRQLRVPADLAFGEEGIEGFIPPNTTLVMQVELLQP